MKIEWWRGGTPQGEWLTVEHMIEDLQKRNFELQPGDKMFVRADEPPKLRVVPRRPLSLVP
jgi:hypothetical protein